MAIYPDLHEGDDDPGRLVAIDPELERNFRWAKKLDERQTLAMLRLGLAMLFMIFARENDFDLHQEVAGVYMLASIIEFLRIIYLTIEKDTASTISTADIIGQLDGESQ